jgi:hypothetical protein
MTGQQVAAGAKAAGTRRWAVRPAAPGTGGEASPGRSRPARALAMLRRHWLVAVLLAAGVVLRALTLAAYHPALLYIDTLKYLYNDFPDADPLGYKVLLRVLLTVGDLGTVVVIQHLAGLAMAVALYVTLVRRGAARWLAAIAVAPVLLDAYQVQMEQTIMPDVWFEVLIVAGLVVLLWRPAVTWPFVVAAGIFLGASATFRQVGEVLVLPAVLYLVVAGGGWRRVIGRSAAMAAAFALPILCYCTASYIHTGHFWLAAQTSTAGRLMAAADCATLRLPAAVRPLCPTPSEQANGPDWLFHSASSPLNSATVPPGMSRKKLFLELDSAIEHQQPLRVAAAIGRDAVRLFAESRAYERGITPISRWQFQTHYPTYHPEINLGRGNRIIVDLRRTRSGPFTIRTLSPAYGGRAQVDRPVAAFLRSYQLDGGYTPGPLLALFTLAGLAGSLLALIRRRGSSRSRQLALACLLLTGAAVTVLLLSDALEFSWRYQLPALVTLPPAGILGIAAVASRRKPRELPQPQPQPQPQPEPESGSEPAAD